MLTERQVQDIKKQSAIAHQHAPLGHRDGAKAQQAVAALLADRRELLKDVERLRKRNEQLEAEFRTTALSRGYVEPYVWSWSGSTYVYDGWRVTEVQGNGRTLADHEATAAFEAGRRYQDSREREDQ